ncbi:tetratricopeptide repeat protein [Shewanella electrodiphila]|uniref:Tetratricopeptide repeat protein n=1 Tax=Shewanella electrodiphila TaxID=934143 RepID=A0ABT0KIY9_9GAMM|nr:tetratricopeptide repeat protein [Shewanella electrodiphila]MCL1043802.1 tetratricopeptide repeat protein [Shewanella electrodiphila]
MMSLNQFTKPLSKRVNRRVNNKVNNKVNNTLFSAHVTIKLLLGFSLMILSACSTMTNDQASENAEANGIDALDSSMVDMVNTDDGIASSVANGSVGNSSNKQTANNGALNDITANNYNLYAEQAQQRLANVPSTVLTQYQDALALMKQQQFDQADALFDQVLLAQPTLSGALVNKALIAINKSDFSQAESLLNQAIAVNDKNPYAFQLKAFVARKQGQFEQAEKDYLTALSIWPNYPEAQVNLAILLELYRGKLLDSRRYYQSYLLLKPDDVQAQRWLAGVEIKIQRAGLNLQQGEG